MWQSSYWPPPPPRVTDDEIISCSPPFFITNVDQAQIKKEDDVDLEDGGSLTSYIHETKKKTVQRKFIPVK